MRSIWKGAIGFGLVTIPVRLYSATEERDVSFHQVRRSDGSRIRYRRVAESDSEEVPYSEIAKGYELASGETVVLTDEDLADLPLSTSRVVDVLGFVPLDQIDPIYFAKSYYLEPEKPGVKPYVLLRDALEKSGRVGLVKVALRQRETLATLRVRDGVFVLETMLWPDEVREPRFAFLDETVEVRQQELAMAASLIDSLATDFAPDEYSDSYREALQAVIEAKVAGREVVAPAVAADTGGGQVVDLMAALRASVEQARKGRAAGGEPAGEEATGPPATPPAKTPAKAPARSTATKPAKAPATSAKAPAGSKGAAHRNTSSTAKKATTPAGGSAGKPAKRGRRPA